MSNANDFIIENGVLVKYTGDGGDVVIPDGVLCLGDFVFSGCQGITGVSIPNSVTSIGEGVFSRCKGLTSVTVPQGVVSIGRRAFCWCSSLKMINLPSSVKSIGEDAFSACYRGRVLCAPKGSYVEKYAKIYDIPFTAYQQDASTTSKSANKITKSFVIEAGILFEYRGKGGDVVIPKGVTSIGDYAFEDCEDLISVTLPTGVTSIGEGAFSWCQSLEKINIPSTVKRIGERAFEGCDSLEKITIPVSVTKIGDDAFEDLTIYTAEGSYAERYADKNDIAVVVQRQSIAQAQPEKKKRATSSKKDFVIEGSVLSGYKGSGGDVVIPKGVTSIGKFAFEGCDGIESIKIPVGVTSIGDGAFSWCERLVSVTIPDGVKSIGERAFEGCESLEDIIIPESVKRIGSDAFSDLTIHAPEGSYAEKYAEKNDIKFMAHVSKKAKK